MSFLIGPNFLYSVQYPLFSKTCLFTWFVWSPHLVHGIIPVQYNEISSGVQPSLELLFLSDYPNPALLYFFFKSLFLQSRFRVTAKLRGGYRAFPLPPAPHAPPYPSSTSHQSDTFVAIDEPMLTHHYHPTSMVCIRSHTWCHALCEFGSMSNDMCPSLQYHTEQVHCPKCPIHPSLTPWFLFIFTFQDVCNQVRAYENF